MSDLASRSLCFKYTNYKGQTAMRWATPVTETPLRWGVTEWHPKPGWLLRAFDHDKGQEREFALEDCQFEPTAQITHQEHKT